MGVDAPEIGRNQGTGSYPGIGGAATYCSKNIMNKL
jgi:hypothetical protein